MYFFAFLESWSEQIITIIAWRVVIARDQKSRSSKWPLSLLRLAWWHSLGCIESSGVVLRIKNVWWFRDLGTPFGLGSSRAPSMLITCPLVGEIKPSLTASGNIRFGWDYNRTERGADKFTGIFAGLTLYIAAVMVFFLKLFLHCLSQTYYHHTIHPWGMRRICIYLHQASLWTR